MAQPSMTTTADISLEAASDALLSDYLDRLATLASALGPSTTHHPVISEETAKSLHDEAMDRRALLQMFSRTMHVAEPLSSNLPERPDPLDSINQERLTEIPNLLELNSAELNVWSRWIPEVDDLVLVYVSKERQIWPGKIIPLDYFAASAFPDGIPRHRLFAVRIYSFKESPILSLKCHIAPLGLRHNGPQAGRKSSSLKRAYQIAVSPLVYDIEAIGEEGRNKAAWSARSGVISETGMTWATWSDWIRRQEKLQTEKYGNAGVQEVANRILGDLNSRGYIRLDRILPATDRPVISIQRRNLRQDRTGRQIDNSPAPTRAQMKRSRKAFRTLLEDPIIGPALNKLDLRTVGAALSVQPPTVQPSRQSGRLRHISPRTSQGNLIQDVGIHPAAVQHVLSIKRKRSDEEETVSGPKVSDFSSPVTGLPVSPIAIQHPPNSSDIRMEEASMDFPATNGDGRWRKAKRRARQAAMNSIGVNALETDIVAAQTSA